MIPPPRACRLGRGSAPGGEIRWPPSRPRLPPSCGYICDFLAGITSLCLSKIKHARTDDEVRQEMAYAKMRPTACTVRGACNPPITPFPSNRKTAYRSTVECHTGSTSHLWISTTRARLAGTWVDGLLTGRAWLRRGAWSVERLASEPGGLVPTTVTDPPPIPFRAGTFSRRVSCCEARLRCLSTERHCRRSCA